MKDVQIEKNIISAVLQDTELIDELIEKTNPEYFTNPIARKVYQWIRKQYQQNKKISIVRLKRETNIQIEEIIDTTIIAVEFEEWLNILHQLYVRRQLAKSAKEIYALAKKEGMEVDEYQHKAQETIFKATNGMEIEKKIVDLETALYQSHSNFAKRKESGNTKGLRTHFPSIDAKIGGLQKGHITVLAGQTSMGKTSFALQLVTNLIKNNKKVLYISLEMDADELVDRLVTMDARVPSSDFMKGVSKAQELSLEAAYNRFYEKKDNLIISYERGLTVEDIKAKARKIKRETDIDFIVVDYLQMIKPPQEETLSRRIGEVVLQLRNLAGELDLPLMLLSQLNRSTDGRPNLKNLRDSGMIEEIADEVWFLYRPAYEKEAMEEIKRQKAELIMAKGRTLGKGMVELVWYPEIQVFQDSYLDKHGEEIEIVRG